MAARRRVDRSEAIVVRGRRPSPVPLLHDGVPLARGGVAGQAWRRGGPRQALLARVFEGIEVRPLDERLGRAAAELLAAMSGHDVIDAALVLLAQDGDLLVTSDVEDLEELAAASGRHVEITRA